MKNTVIININCAREKDIKIKFEYINELNRWFMHSHLYITFSTTISNKSFLFFILLMYIILIIIGVNIIFNYDSYIYI